MPQIKQQNELLQERLVPVGLIFLIDILLTALSFVASYLICANFFPDIVKHRFVIQMPVIIAITSLIFLTIGIYKGLVNYDRLRQVYSIFNAICLANILTIVFAVVNGKLIMEEDLAIPLSIILVHSLLSFVALVASRFLYKRLLINIKERFVRTANVVLVHNFDQDALELKQFSSVLDERRKRVVLQLNFMEDGLSERLSYSDIEDNYIEAFVLLFKERPINSFTEALEKLARFKKPIFFGYSPYSSKDKLSMNNIRLNRLDLAHLFAPQMNFQGQLNVVKNNMGSASLLVSGAGGAIAKEYIRALLGFGFKGKIILLDNSETALNIISNFCQTFKGVSVVPKLGDVKERKFVQRIFEEHRPEYVLHAAGNNKPEFFDDNILNVLKENVLATKIIADLSLKFFVKRFVFCSSTEAERPKSTLEVCKRVSEMYLDSLNTPVNPFNFVSLRLNKVFDPENSFINYLQWQIDLGRTIDVSRFGAYKTFSNKRDVANTLIHVTANPNPLGSVLVSRLGLKIKTSILVDFMTSLGIQKAEKDVNLLEDLEANQKGSPKVVYDFNGLIKNIFNKPPLEVVSHKNGLSKTQIQKTVETICLNILLNSKDYPEVFTLIHDFEPGYWNDLYEDYQSNQSDKGVIRLGQQS